MLQRLSIAAMALTASFASVAQFDDLGDLKGSTIAYAGAFETVSCRIGGKYNCMNWPENCSARAGTSASRLRRSRAAPPSARGFSPPARRSHAQESIAEPVWSEPLR